jgi:anti-sigma factor RsiW
MNHDELQDLIHPYVDGELDIVNARELEKHLGECDQCRALERRVRSLSGALHESAAAYRAPKRLRKNVRTALRREAKPEASRFWIPLAVGACALLLLGLVVLQMPRQARNSMADELVANHVRSLLATHLVDVPSSDQHTVKPWFDGKVDFAPDVRDLAAQGFPLVGGRLDYVASRTVVALVYDRHKHPINLFVFPGSSASTTALATLNRRGFNLVQWSRGGMDYWAVSDLNAVELQDFAALFAR